MVSPRLISTSHGTNREAFTAGDWTLFLFLAGIWGSSFLLMAIGLDAFHPGVVTFLRVSLGACVLSLVPRARAVSIDRIDRPKVWLLALVWVALPFTLFPIAQQWIDSAVAGMLNGATPIFTALIATLLLRTSPGRIQITGLVVGFAGIVAVALPSAGSDTTQAAGVVIILIATIGYAVSLNMVPPLQQKYGSLPVMSRVLRIATVMVAPFGLVSINGSSWSVSSFLAVAATGVLGTGFAFVAMGVLAGSVGATRASFLTYLIPVVALILGVVFREEVIAPVALAGVGMVILGAFLASRGETSPSAPGERSLRCDHVLDEPRC